MRPNKHRSTALAAWSLIAALAPHADAGDDLAKPPPLTMPLFDGDEQRTHQPPKGPLKRPTIPDYRQLYDMTVDCWPAKSWFRGELHLEARASTKTSSGTSSIDPVNGNVSQSADRYIALVARIPLISASELDKERNRELERHGRVADAVGELVSAFSERVMNTRQLTLLRALEKRAQQRVALGVAETNGKRSINPRLAA